MAGLGWKRARALGQPTRFDGLPALELAQPLARQQPPRQRPARHRRWRWGALFFLALIAVLGAGISFLLTAPTFRIQQVLVQGTTNAQILASIQALHLEGANLFLADTAQAATRMQAIPAVADAHITRRFPDTLLVVLIERQPVLLWQVGSGLFSVDASGALIAQVPDVSTFPLLPLISDDHPLDALGQPFAPGGKVDPAIVKMARQLLERLPREAGMTGFSLHETREYGMVVVSADGWQARLGDARDLDDKLALLVAILHLVQQRHQALALVDLRFSFSPYYRLQAPATSG
jgi:cell division protein FtsQ